MKLKEFLKDLSLQFRTNDRAVSASGNWRDFLILPEPSSKAFRKIAEELGLKNEPLTPKLFGAVDSMLQKWYDIERNNERWIKNLPHHWMRCALTESDKERFYSESYRHSILAFRRETGLNISPSCKYISEPGNANDSLRTSSILSGIREPEPVEVLSTSELRERIINDSVHSQGEGGAAPGIPFNFERDYEWVKSDPEEIRHFHLSDSDMVSLYQADSRFYPYFSNPCTEVQLLRCREDWSNIFEMERPDNEICAAFIREMTKDKNQVLVGFEFDHVRKFIESVRPLYSESNSFDSRAKMFEEYVGVESFGHAYHEVCLQEGLKNAFYTLKTDTMLSFDLSREIFGSPMFARFTGNIREGLECKYPPLLKSEHELRKAAVSLAGEMKEKNFIRNLNHALEKAGISPDKLSEASLDALRRGKDITLPDGTSVWTKKSASGSCLFEAARHPRLSRDEMEL